MQREFVQQAAQGAPRDTLELPNGLSHSRHQEDPDIKSEPAEDPEFSEIDVGGRRGSPEGQDREDGYDAL
jgi:hypothetical protein